MAVTSNRFAILSLLSILQACTSNSGPIVQHGGHNQAAPVWQGPLIGGCHNVSMAKRMISYESNFHHSTKSSLAPELLQTVVKNEFNYSDETDPTERLKKEFSNALLLQIIGLDGRARPFDPFCMRFNESEESVKQLVKKTLPVLGNTIITDREQTGTFYTRVLEREHNTAKWRDLYFIDVAEAKPGETVVWVYRHLEIQRGGDGWVIAQSDGHNEAWILQWIKASLSKRRTTSSSL